MDHCFSLLFAPVLLADYFSGSLVFGASIFDPIGIAKSQGCTFLSIVMPVTANQLSLEQAVQSIEDHGTQHSLQDNLDS